MNAYSWKDVVMLIALFLGSVVSYFIVNWQEERRKERR